MHKMRYVLRHEDSFDYLNGEGDWVPYIRVAKQFFTPTEAFVWWENLERSNTEMDEDIREVVVEKVFIYEKSENKKK